MAMVSKTIKILPIAGDMITAFDRAVIAFIDALAEIPKGNVLTAIVMIQKRLKKNCSDFVGIEAQKKFYLTPPPRRILKS